MHSKLHVPLEFIVHPIGHVSVGEMRHSDEHDSFVVIQVLLMSTNPIGQNSLAGSGKFAQVALLNGNVLIVLNSCPPRLIRLSTNRPLSTTNWTAFRTASEGRLTFAREMEKLTIIEPCLTVSTVIELAEKGELSRTEFKDLAKAVLNREALKLEAVSVVTGGVISVIVAEMNESVTKVL